MLRFYSKIFLVFALFTHLAFAASFTATVDRTHLSAAESFTLTLTYLGITSEKPDLRPLKKAFSLIGVSTSQQTSIINGKQTARQEWQITLFPKHAGTFTLPSLTLDHQTTVPITLTVTKGQAIRPGKQSILMKVALSRQITYVSAPVVYTMKLYAREPVENASISPPVVTDMSIRLLSAPATYQAQLEGTTFDVTEAHFLITPEDTGKHSIHAPVLMGEIPGPSDPESGFQFVLHPIRITAENLPLTVQPIPRSFVGNTFFPATSVTLHQSFSKPMDQWHIGDAITREIVIRAQSANATDIPPLAFGDTSGLNIYPEKPVLQTNFQQGDLMSSRTEQFAIIPLKTGPMTLPAITLHWWDSTNQTLKTASLPAIHVTILPKNQGTPSNTATAISANPDTQTPNVFSTSEWISLAVFLLWLLTCGAWYFSLKRKNKLLERLRHPHRRAIIQAAAANDARATIDALQAWIADKFQLEQTPSLAFIAEYCLSEKLADAIRQLERARYDERHTPWSGEALAKAWRSNHRLKKTSDAKRDEDELPPFYHH